MSGELIAWIILGAYLFCGTVMFQVLRKVINRTDLSRPDGNAIMGIGSLLWPVSLIIYLGVLLGKQIAKLV